jgi:hypothetical protein
MAAKPISKAVSDAILIDWRIGRLSQRELADKHKVSAGLVNKICKGVEQDVAPIVNAQVQVNQALSSHDERMVNAVHEAVDEIGRMQKFFRGANMLVANTVAAKVKREGQNASFKELASAAQALGRTQESVLGKAPDTVINNTNAVQTVIQHTPEQLRKINQDLEDAC